MLLCWSHLCIFNNKVHPQSTFSVFLSAQTWLTLFFSELGKEVGSQRPNILPLSPAWHLAMRQILRRTVRRSRMQTQGSRIWFHVASLTPITIRVLQLDKSSPMDPVQERITDIRPKICRKETGAWSYYMTKEQNSALIEKLKSLKVCAPSF